MVVFLYKFPYFIPKKRPLSMKVQYLHKNFDESSMELITTTDDHLARSSIPVGPDNYQVYVMSPIELNAEMQTKITQKFLTMGEDIIYKKTVNTPFVEVSQYNGDTEKEIIAQYGAIVKHDPAFLTLDNESVIVNTSEAKNDFEYNSNDIVYIMIDFLNRNHYSNMHATDAKAFKSLLPSTKTIYYSLPREYTLKNSQTAEYIQNNIIYNIKTPHQFRRCDNRVTQRPAFTAIDQAFTQENFMEINQVLKRHGFYNIESTDDYILGTDEFGNTMFVGQLEFTEYGSNTTYNSIDDQTDYDSEY